MRFALVHIATAALLRLLADRTVFIAIPSGPGVVYRDRREAIRRTWARHVDPAVTVRFFLKAGEAVDNETDVVSLPLNDTYRGLTHKTVAMLSWAVTQFPTTRFILKADDDTYVAVSNLLAALRATNASFLGRVVNGSSPDRNPRSRWYVSSEAFPNATYPAYAVGGSYVLTRDAALQIVREARRDPPARWLPIEDAQVGIWAERAGIIPHDEGMRVFGNADQCTEHAVSLHYATPRAMERFQRRLDSVGRLCH